MTVGMERERFEEFKRKVLAGWPSDRYTMPEQTKILLTCENGTFIKVALMEMPEELLNEVPQMTKDMLHNKLLIQWTEDLKAVHYANLGRYILQEKWPENEAMKEALREFGFRMQLGAVFV